MRPPGVACAKSTPGAKPNGYDLLVGRGAGDEGQRGEGELVLDLILADLTASASTILVSPQSPDGDEGNFVIDGKPARAIYHFDGWYVPVNLE
jgi:hypothetical protein